MDPGAFWAEGREVILRTALTFIWRWERYYYYAHNVERCSYQCVQLAHTSTRVHV